jgi:hypothetical protein
MVVLVSSTSTNVAVIKKIVMLAAPVQINRSMTNYCAGVSGNGNRINPRWRPNKKRNGHLSPRSRTNVYHLPASRPPLFLIVTTFKLQAKPTATNRENPALQNMKFLHIFSVLRLRIHLFLDLPDPEPFVRGTDPDPSIIKQK